MPETTTKHILVSCLATWFLCVSFVSCSRDEGGPGPWGVQGHCDGGILAGMARKDITPPIGIGLMGMADPTQIAEGIHTRLYATALVLMDSSSGDKIALVTCDLLAVTQGLRAEVLEKIGGRGFEDRNVLLCATHTHSGPGGYSLYLVYNFGIGLRPSVFHFIAGQIGRAICEADDAKAPAAIAFGSTPLYGLTRNRSIEAHLADHGLDLEPGRGSPEMDPEGPSHPVDTSMRALRIDRLDGAVCRPMGLVANFGIHGTLLKHDNHLYSGDVHGVAVQLLEAMVQGEKASQAGGNAFLCAYSNSAQGDISPCIRDGYRGLGYNSYSDTEISARGQAQAMAELFDALGGSLSTHARLETGFAFVRLDDQRISGTDRSTSPYAGFGFPMIGGAEDGPTLFHDLLRTEGARSPSDDPDQGDKIVLFKAYPGLLVPSVAPLQIVRIGSVVLAAVPGEPTIELGRRIGKAIRERLRPSGVQDVWIVGLANEYVDYFTTPEEYRMQHYEGGSTLYGPQTGPLLVQEFAGLAGRMADGSPPPATSEQPPDLSLILEAAELSERPLGDDPQGRVGTVLSEPHDTARFDTASFRWVGGNPRAEHHPDECFVAVEREVAEGRWEEFLADGRLGLVVKAMRSGGEYDWEAVWETKKDTPLGRYRFKVRGASQQGGSRVPYSVLSRAFRVVASDALCVGPAARWGAKKILFTASYPDPDPAVHFLDRERYVQSGAARLETGGVVRVASYESAAGGFVVDGEGVPSGQRLFLEADGLRDAYGNFNGRACWLEVP
jgi:neutral ceramidase